MKLPPRAEPGMVLRYAYLWFEEHQMGLKEGKKDRPAAVIAIRSDVGPSDLVYVVPITHSPPQREVEKLKLPIGIKRRLGLDDDESWIDATEINAFAWPGFDLRPKRRGGSDQSGSDQTCLYGYLPSRFLSKLQAAIQQNRAEHRLRLVPR